MTDRHHRRFSGLRAKYAEELAARRKAAEEEIELLRDSVSKKVQLETSRDGKLKRLRRLVERYNDAMILQD